MAKGGEGEATRQGQGSGNKVGTECAMCLQERCGSSYNLPEPDATQGLGQWGEEKGPRGRQAGKTRGGHYGYFQNIQGLWDSVKRYNIYV